MIFVFVEIDKSATHFQATWGQPQQVWNLYKLTVAYLHIQQFNWSYVCGHLMNFSPIFPLSCDFHI